MEKIIVVKLSAAPEVTVVADELSLEMGVSTTLNSATLKSATLHQMVYQDHMSGTKNGKHLINATTITILVNNVFIGYCILPLGEYTCVVHSDFYTSFYPILIQEKGMLYSHLVKISCVSHACCIYLVQQTREKFLTGNISLWLLHI